MEESRKVSSFLKGSLLIAMPDVRDKFFVRSVVYLCEHSEQGAMGIIINNVAADIDISGVLQQVDFDKKVELEDIKLRDCAVMSGGPVEAGRGFILHTSDYYLRDDTLIIDDDFSLTASVSALVDIVRGKGPAQYLFAVGCAGWEPGALENEMQGNAWFVAPAKYSLVFSTPPDKIWRHALEGLGVDPLRLSPISGNA